MRAHYGEAVIILKRQWRPAPHTWRMESHRAALAIFAGLVAFGCATTAPTLPDTTLTYPREVILVPAPMLVDDASLHALFTPNAPRESPESRQAIRNAIDAADTHALAEMRKVLQTQLGVTFDDSSAVSRLVDELRIKDASVVVTHEIAAKLRATSKADAVLRFRITDYGVTPKAWQTAYIVFEVTTTLGIAAIAYAYPATRAVAGVYLVEEGVEETAEGYAGYWALNEVSRPVRIEAELISLDTGTQAWKGSATGFSDVGLSRLFRKVGPEERDAQLNSSIDEAIASSVADMRKTLAVHDVALRGESQGVHDF